MEENDLKSKHWEFYNPMFSTEHNLDMAVGAIEFRDKVIKNLRGHLKQSDEVFVTLKNLVESLESASYSIWQDKQRFDKSLEAAKQLMGKL